MDFGKAFTFVFDDEEWLKKIALAAVISLIPIVGSLVVMGWGLEVTKRVIRKELEELPGWEDFGGYLLSGFMVLVIGFVFFLPMILVQACGSGGLALLGNTAEQEAAMTAVGIVTACLSCLAILYSIAASLVVPAAIGRYAATGELGAAFKFGAVIKMVRENLGAYFMVFLGVIVSSLVASLGTILCVIGVLFTTAYSMAINGHLVGQAYNVADGSGAAVPAEPIPAAD